MIDDMMPEDTGARLTTISFTVTGDGRHAILTFGAADRSTKVELPSPRIFTDYVGLSLLINTLHQAARASVENLVKSGAADDLTKDMRDLVITHAQSCSVGISLDKTTVSLQIQAAEGILSSFAIDPETARNLGQSLMDAANQVKPKTSLN